MNNTISRRKLVAVIGATGAAAVAGCTGDEGSASTPDESDENSVFDGIEAVGIDGEAQVDLQVSLVEDHGVDRIALQNADGAELLSASVSPEETRVDLTIQDDYRDNTVEPGTHEVIAYNGETTADTTEWEATREVTVDDIRLFKSESSEATDGFEINLVNTGDLVVIPEDGYVSAGFPVEKNSDYVGRFQSPNSPYIWPSDNDSWAVMRGSSLYNLTNEGESCGGEAKTTEITLEFENHGDVSLEIEFAPDGEYIEGGLVEGCTDTEITDWEIL